MGVIATIAIPAGEFTLGSLLSRDPSIRVRLERVVPVGERFIPYFWVADDGIESIESSLEAEPDIEEFRIIDRADAEVLVRLGWTERVDGFLAELGRGEASILQAVGEAGRWRFQLRFDDHDDLTAFYRRCVDHGLSVDLERVHNPGIPGANDPAVDLTEAQRRTLALALDRGYFEVPRRTDLGELAGELGVSDSAVSQRLRRGVAAVLATVVLEAD